MNNSEIAGLLRFYQLAAELKRVRRQGWLDRGVVDPESVASHMWGAALLVWVLSRNRDDLEKLRLIELALVHDLAEAVTGDATPFDDARTDGGEIPAEMFHTEPIYSAEARRRKRRRERAAIESLAGELSPDLSAMIRVRWQEYDQAETPEARFVKQVDKLETLLQAEAYRSAQPEIVIESFWLGARRDIADPDLVDVLTALENTAEDSG